MASFRSTLLEISRHIDSATLDNMKYMSKDVIGAARLERVKTVTGLFLALEECGKLSSGNVTYLMELLELEKKPQLVQKLAHFPALPSQPEVPFQMPQRTANLFAAQDPHTNNYRQLLKTLSNRLTVDEVISFCYVSAEAESAGLRHRADISGTILFNFLEESVLISPTNLQYLQNHFNVINRMDLCQMIDQYTRVYLAGQPQPLKRPSTYQAANHNSAPPPYNPYYPENLQSLRASMQQVPTGIMPQAGPQDADHNSYSSPIEAVDDDDNGAVVHIPSTFRRIHDLGHCEPVDVVMKERQSDDYNTQRKILEVNKGAFESVEYEKQMKQIEQEHQREMLAKEYRLKEDQNELEEKEYTINRLTQQCETQLHIIRQTKTESTTEKERLLKRVQEYERIIQGNVKELDNLRQERAHLQGAVGPIAERYKMDSRPHGIAVIINNFEFYSSEPSDDPLQGRKGSCIDEENLRITWEYLGYDVNVKRNLTASNLTRELMQIALKSHESYDSFVCCILSHGYLDGIYGTDSKPVKINDIASLFKGNFCPTLANKPKLFFIQACRGDDEDRGVVVQKDAKGDSEEAFRHSLPSEADFLFGYATPPGSVSWRSPRYGSWYISKLCEVLVDFGPQQDLLSILTIVNQRVSEAYTTQGYKQCPAPVTLLRKQVCFFVNPQLM